MPARAFSGCRLPPAQHCLHRTTDSASAISPRPSRRAAAFTPLPALSASAAFNISSPLMSFRYAVIHASVCFLLFFIVLRLMRAIFVYFVRRAAILFRAFFSFAAMAAFATISLHRQRQDRFQPHRAASRHSSMISISSERISSFSQRPSFRQLSSSIESFAEPLSLFSLIFN